MPPPPPPEGPELASGAISFETLAEIAAGDTARVDLCRILPPDPRAGGLCAVKRLHPHIAADPTFVKQFLDEVRITYWLRHANVVEVAGWGTDAQGSYLAVELVQGVSLLRLLKTILDTREAFPERMVVYVASRICAGLGAAHALRAPNGELLHLVHRDLTPGNVLVGFNGEVKITDFGTAKAKQRLTKTLTGMRKGEPTYMAPEQAAAGEIDARADLFSLGVMLFELFAGRRPWIAKSDYEMVEITARDPPADLRELRPKIDKELVSVVNRCLERDPAARFQSAFEIASRLDEWLTAHGYQEGNEEALGRFVRRNAMRQMRWFERAIVGELSPKKIGRELPRVPTYTEHTGRVDPHPPGSRSATEERAPVAVASPKGAPAVTGRPLPPRPEAPADPRSIRAANAVQQLKKLAPPVEPPRGRARQRTPTLDEDDPTDVELRVGTGSLRRAPAAPVNAGAKAAPRIARPDGEDENEDDAGEDFPTLVKTGDAKLQAFRAEARRQHEGKVGGGATVQLVPALEPPDRDDDDESDQHITEVKQKKEEELRLAALDLPPTPAATPEPVEDLEPDLPTEPRQAARPRPVYDGGAVATLSSGAMPPPDPADAQTPIPPRKPRNMPLRQVIPPSPDVPPRPFPIGPSSRPNKSAIPSVRAEALAPNPRAEGSNPERTTVRPPSFHGPPPAPLPPPPAPPPPGPESSSISAGGEELRTSTQDDVQVLDRHAFRGPAPMTEEAVVAEADRLAIEAVRCSEEARAAQLRADRKIAAANLAGDAARIATDAVRMIRSSGLAAAVQRLDEARALEQSLQSGKLPGGEVMAALRAGHDGASSMAGAPHAEAPAGGGQGYRLAAPSRVSTYPVAPSVPPSLLPPQGASHAPAAHEARPQGLPHAVMMVPAAPPPPAPPPPVQPSGPFAPFSSAIVDADAFRANLKPSILGLPMAAVAGLAAVGLGVLVVVILLLAK